MKKLLALVLAMVMTLGLATVGTNAAFSDADSIEYKEAVDVMSALGVFAGMDNGSFSPTGILTREQAAKIVTYMILGKSAADALVTIAAPYSDVAADRWSAGSIAYCANEGILAGKGNGTFGPDEQLTGLAFAKMCLVALGYKADAEGLVGESWSINAAKLALTTGLTDDMESVALSAPMTREQACKMAFNTELATMVKYDNNSVISAGDVTIKTQSAAEPLDTASLRNKFVAGNNLTVQFCEKYASKLQQANETMYGHENRYYTVDGKRVSEDVATDKTLATVNSVSDFTKLYTKGDKKYVGFEDNGTAVTVYLNGTKTSRTNAIAAGSANAGLYASNANIDTDFAADIQKNGVIVEFIDTSDPVDNKYDVINVIAKSVYTLTADAATKEITNSDTQVKVPGVTGMGGFSSTYTVENVFGYEGLKKGDVVLVYTANGDTFIEKAESVNGVVSGRNGGKPVMNGTAYSTSGLTNASNNWNADYTNTYTFYLDNGNNIVKTVKETSKADDFAYVLESKWVTGAGLADSDTAQARLLKLDGTNEVVTVSKINGTKTGVTALNETSEINTAIDDKFVTYKVSDGKYELTTKTTSDALTAIAGNKADFATGFVGNSSTIFLINTGSAGDPKVTVYTGIANVPSVAATTTDGVYVDGGYAKYVYAAASATSISDDSSDYVYIPGTGDSYTTMEYSYIPESKSGEGDQYYEFNAVVNGVPDTKIKVAALTDNVDTNGTLTNTEASIAVNTLYKVISKDSNGYISLLSTSGVMAGTAGVKYSDGTLTLGGQAYKTASDTVLYYIAKDGAVTELTPDAVTDDVTDLVAVTKKADGSKTVKTAYIFETISITPKIFALKYSVNGGDDVSKTGLSLVAGGTTTYAPENITSGTVAITSVTTEEGTWAVSGTVTATAGATDAITVTVTAENGTTTQAFTINF